MKAVVVHDFADFRFEDVPVPEPADRDILMKVAYSGICGSDKAIYQNRAPWDLTFPFTPGHEFVGEVADLGSEAKKEGPYKIGDKITAELIIPCRKCFFCRSGKYNLCDDPKFLGSSLNGGWAEYMRIPGNATVYKIPSALALKDAAIIEPLSCSLWAVERARIGFRDTVVISGLGPIGLGALMAARLKNPQQLIALDVDDRTFPCAQKAGADYVFNVNNPDYKQALEELTDGLGPSVVIEASGSVGALKNCVDIVRKGGRVVVYGVYGTDAPVNWSIISEFKELDIIGGHLAPNMFPVCLSLLAQGKLNAGLLITHVLKLADYRKGLELRETVNEPVIKALLKP